MSIKCLSPTDGLDHRIDYDDVSWYMERCNPWAAPDDRLYFDHIEFDCSGCGKHKSGVLYLDGNNLDETNIHFVDFDKVEEYEP